MATEGIGTLVAYLGVDTVALEAGKARAGAALKDIDDRMNVTASQAGKLSGAIIAAGAVMAAVMVKRTVEAMDAQGEMAQQIGISIQALGGLTFAAGQAGLSQDELAGNVTKLNRNMQEAASGSRTQSDAFRDVGISATDASGSLRSADDVLLDIADRFETMPDGAAKTAIAMDLFGKSGAKMIPLLNQGSTAIREQMQLAQQLGLVLSNETAASADEFADQMQVLSQVGQGFANRLTAELLPTLTNVGGVLIDVAKDGDTMATASSALATVLKSLVSAGLWVSHTFTQLGKDIGAVAAAAVAAASGNFSGAHDIMVERNAESAADSERFSARIKKVWSETADAADASAMKQQAALLRTTEEQKKAAEEAEKAADRQRKANAQTVAALQEQAATLGMTAGQAQVYALAMNGASDAQIRAAESARQTVDAFAALKEIGNIKIGAMDGDDAAVASLQEKYARLNEIIAANPELQRQAAEAAAMLATQYQNGVDAQILAGQTAHEAFIDQQAQRVEAIKTQYATEKEMATQKYAEDLELLDQARLNGLLTDQAYNEISAQTKQRHEARMGDIEAQGAIARKKFAEMNTRQQASLVLGEMTKLTAGVSRENRAMFEINKQAATAEAVLNAYKNISLTMASYPYPLNIGMAALTGAAAFAQVQQIQSTQFGSSAASTTAGIPSTAGQVPTGGGAASGPGQSHTLAIQGIDESQLYSGKQIRGLVDSLKEFQRDGGTLIIT